MDYDILNKYIKQYSQFKGCEGLDPIAIATVILTFIDDSCGEQSLKHFDTTDDAILDKLEARKVEALNEMEAAHDWVKDNFKSRYLESIDVEISNSDFFVFLNKLPMNFMVTIVDDLRAKGVDIYYTNYRKFYERIMPKVYKLFKAIIKKESAK